MTPLVGQGLRFVWLCFLMYMTTVPVTDLWHFTHKASVTSVRTEANARGVGYSHMSADIICLYKDPFFSQVLYTQWLFFSTTVHTEWLPFFQNFNVKFTSKSLPILAEKDDKIYTEWPAILGSSHQKWPILGESHIQWPFFLWNPTPNAPCFHSPMLSTLKVHNHFATFIQAQWYKLEGGRGLEL